MKICLLGPTYPFRGGIARYTTLLFKALNKGHKVKLISFKRMYPKWLYPGKTDRDPSQRIPDRSVEYLLDSCNPLTWWSTAKAIKAFGPDMFVLQWWVAFWALPFWMILKSIKRAENIEVVIVCHNAAEHESNWIKRWASAAVLKLADRIIVHSEEERLRLGWLLGALTKIETSPLPTFVGSEIKPFTFPEESPQPFLLFFGFVREYKGLSVLLDAMPDIAFRTGAKLLIVGEFWKGKRQYLEQIKRLRIGASVGIVDRYVPDSLMADYFAIADLVVLPYRKVSGSAVAQLAYGFNRPVIASDVGALSDVIIDGENGRLVEPGNVKALAQAVVESLEPKTLERLTRNAAEKKARFSWGKMVEILTRKDKP